MRGMLSVLLTSLVLLTSALPVVRAARAAEAESKTEQATAVITDAGPHRWVNDGGPYGGDVYAVAVCASEPDVLYAGGISGVYRSTDGGATWRTASPLVPGERRRSVYDVAVDPATSDTVYAVSRNLYESSDQNELHKSTDGGETWRKIDSKVGWSFRRVAVDARDSNTLYLAAFYHGVLKSTDGGKTWAIKNKGLWGRHLLFFAIDEHDPEVLVVGMARTSALFVSGDGGKTWRKAGGALEGVSFGPLKRAEDNAQYLEIPLKAATESLLISHDGGRLWYVKEGSAHGYDVCGLLVDDDNPQRMEISISSPGPDQVYLSTDGAETWQLVKFPFHPDSATSIRASPSTEGVLFARKSGDEYYFSDDGGKTWDFLYSVRRDPDRQNTATIAELRRCRLMGFHGSRGGPWRLVFHPTDLDVAYTADARYGVLRTGDAGGTWSLINEGLVAFSARDMACDPRTPGVTYVCGRSGVYKSMDSGRTWKLISEPDGRAPPLVVHPLDPTVILVGKDRQGADISADGGRTWREIKEVPSDCEPAAFLFDPKNANHFFIATQAGIIATTDRGNTWQRQPGTIIAERGWHKVRQTNPEIIYELKSNRVIRRSRDLGQTWEEIRPPIVRGDTYAFVRVHPRHPEIVFARSYNALFRSADAGDTWKRIELPEYRADVDCVGLDPKDPSTFYLGGCGQQETVLRTRDGGHTFERLGNGLPGVHITRIVVSPADGVVYAATSGAGVYRLEIEEQAGPDESQE